MKTYQEISPDSLSSIPPALLRRGKPCQVEFRETDLVKNHEAGSFTSFQQRTISNLLARLYEAQRHQDLIDCGQPEPWDHRFLWNRLIRSQHYNRDQGLQRNILNLEQKIRGLQKDADFTRLNRWTEKMKNDKGAYKWLRQTAAPFSTAIKTDSYTEPVPSVQTSLDNLSLAEFWQQIWNRAPIDVDAIWDDLVAHTPEHDGCAEWPDLTPLQLSQAAKKVQKTAPGLDGWLAHELLLFNNDMWRVASRFFTLCEDQGAIPTPWRPFAKYIFQKVNLYSQTAPHLRPISVTNIWWRICNSARFHQPEVQEWLKSTAPQNVYGGIPGLGVDDAFAPLLLKDLEGWTLGSLDLTKAFDFAQPNMVCRLLERQGMPHRSARLLQSMWDKQIRYLQLLDNTRCEPCYVCSSLPQGDCFSMIAMFTILIPIMYHIQAEFPQALQSIYADDRSFASATAAEAVAVKERWRIWFTRVGLQKNSAKQ